jgi:signal transduction histidine kinase
MTLTVGAYVGVPLVTAVATAVVAYWVRTHHGDVRGSEWFVASMVLGVAWMVTHIAHILASDVGTQTLLTTFAAKFAVLSFVSNVVFASRYTETDFDSHPVVRLALVAVGLSVLTPSWVEPFRGLFYEQWVSHTDPFSYVSAEPAAGYALLGVATAALSAYAMYRLVRFMLATPRRSGTQLVLLVVGSFSVMAAATLGNVGAFPAEGSMNTVFGVLPYAVLSALALFRFRLFDVRPIARNAVVENLRDPVFVLDGDDRLVDYNDAATRVVPAVTEAISKPFDAVCPTVASEMDDGTPERTSTRLTLAVDGETRHYSMTVSSVGDGGTDRDWSSVLLRDVTDLERSRWQLAAQNDRLEQVASTVSHDLRNPINVADGYAAMAHQRLAEADSHADAETVEQTMAELATVRDNHERMTDIIEDILTIARGGKTVEETEPVDLVAVARDGWRNVETGDATLSVTGDHTLEADRSRLLSVFENLFRNAVEHGSTGPDSQTPRDAVEHSATNVTVGPTERGFFVADDGPGIPERHRDRVFEYGYTTGDGNTGLGLSIVRTMTESHGWSVELADTETGARFEFVVGDAPTTPEQSPDRVAATET